MTNLSLQQQFPLLSLQLVHTCHELAHLMLVSTQAVNVLNSRLQYRTFAVHLLSVDAEEHSAITKLSHNNTLLAEELYFTLDY